MKSSPIRLVAIPALRLGQIGGSEDQFDVFRAGDPITIHVYVHNVNSPVSFKPAEEALGMVCILAHIRNPFIVWFAFICGPDTEFHLAMPFMIAGELRRLIDEYGSYPFKHIRFLAAEIVCALESLHDPSFVLKDESWNFNIYLDLQGHILLSDFGFVDLKLVDTQNDEHSGGEEPFLDPTVLGGDLRYIPPEIILGKGSYGPSADWWKFGVVLYELIAKFNPFINYAGDDEADQGHEDNNEDDQQYLENCRRIVNEPVSFPGPESFPPVAQDLVSRLLMKDPQERLSTHDVHEIKAHPFFRDVLD